MHNQLLKKIENKTAVIGIIGLGYVGLPLALEYAIKGFKTIGTKAALPCIPDHFHGFGSYIVFKTPAFGRSAAYKSISAARALLLLMEPFFIIHKK